MSCMTQGNTVLDVQAELHRVRTSRTTRQESVNHTFRVNKRVLGLFRDMVTERKLKFVDAITEALLMWIDHNRPK